MSTEQFNEMFAKNLRHFMDLNGFSQAELSRVIKVSESTIHSWLNATRTPRMKRVDQLCRLFDIDRSDLITSGSEKESHYYLSKETRDIANQIAKDKDLKLLFDAAKDVSAEDLQAVHTLLKSLKRKEMGDEDY